MKQRERRTSKKTTSLLGISKENLLPRWLEKNWVFVLFLISATVVTYQPIWHAGFLTDDNPLLVKNPLIHQSDGWWRVWISHAVDYVPATSTSFWMEWQLWNANPLGYHLDNVLLHAFSSILIWQILRRLIIPGARLASLIFALHPVNVASVAWIAERKNTLAMVFYLTMLWTYLAFEKGGRRRWYWLAVLAFVAGIFSKTAIAPAPFILLGMAWWQRRKITKRDLWRTAPFFLLAIGAGILAIWIQHSVDHSYSVRPETFMARVAGAGLAVWFYLGKCAWPQNLIFLYPKWHVDPMNLLSYLPLGFVIVLFVVAWNYRERWGQAVLLGFGYFILLLLPVLGLVDISFMRATLVADHWQYFAIIGPIALISAGLTVFFDPYPKALQLFLCACLVTVLGLETRQQSKIYVNLFTFWAETAAKNPGSFLAQSAFGNVLFQKGKAAEAIAHYRKALELEPSFFDANYDLGNICLQENQPAEAILYFEAALNIQPHRVEALNNLAWILATCPNNSLRDGPRSIELSKKADELSQGADASVIGTLAAAYAEGGQFSMAISSAKRALGRVKPQHNNTIDELQHQLDMYQKGLPFRDYTQISTISHTPF